MARKLRRGVASSSLTSFLIKYASTIPSVATISQTKRSYDKQRESRGRRYKRNSSGIHYENYMSNEMLDAFTTPSTATGNNNFVSPYTAQPIFSTATSSSSPHFFNKTIEAQILAAERERVRAEFFATYDVMTGVRIAATLGGFFGLMVFLIVWKSRSSSNDTLKVLKDPKMAAVAAVCMQEEEEREIQEAMVATGMSIFPDEYDAILYRRQRMLSLGNVSAPPMLNRGFRFSSVGGSGSGGGCTNLMAPPRRFSYSAASGAGSLGSGKRKSISESSRILEHCPIGSSFGANDFFIETEDEIENGDYVLTVEEKIRKLTDRHTRTDSTKSKGGLLDVPLPGQDSRRSSSMTCCSTESSYLERRCSAFTLGLTNLPVSMICKLSAGSRTSSTDNWDYVYPDIQVIQPTPKPSPSPSERLQNVQTKPMQVKTSAKSRIETSIRENKSVNLTSKILKKSIDGFAYRPDNVIRKQSIAYYDPEKAQVGHCQQAHFISADNFDSYICNKTNPQQQTSIGIHEGFHNFEVAVEEQQHPRSKLALIELQSVTDKENVAKDFQYQTSPPVTTNTAFENINNNNNNNNNNYSYSSQAINKTTGGAGNSSSISMGSTPLEIDKMNGSCSSETASVKILFNAEKRAPLASLSSFMISSTEYADSEHQTPNKESVFIRNTGNETDEDMQDISSDSEELSLSNNHKKYTPDKKNNINLETHISFASEHVHKHLGIKQLPLEDMKSTVQQRRRPLLQRHTTLSASSSDRISLIEQPLQEHCDISCGNKDVKPNIKHLKHSRPLDTNVGAEIFTNTPPSRSRRGHLEQQYSDPHSLPTNTTTTTEEDTCSTLNTELCAIGDIIYQDSTGGSYGGAESSSTTQHSSPNTVISFARLSPTAGNNTSDGLGLIMQPIVSKWQLEESKVTGLSSISDSVITNRQSTIRMPDSLKDLIMRGNTGPEKKSTISSATSLVFDSNLPHRSQHSKSQIRSELPLFQFSTVGGSIEHEKTEKSDEEESLDPNLPSSSRKWSKETLF